MRKSMMFGAAGVAAVTVIAGGASVANGAWGASNGGAVANSQGKGVAGQPVAVSVSAPSTESLYPGAAGNLTFTISNPNPYPVQVTGFGAGSAGVNGISSTGSVNCQGSGTGLQYTLSPTQAVLPSSGATGSQVAPFTIPAKLGTNSAPSVTVTLPGAVTMGNGSNTDCQGDGENGVVFNVPIAVNAASNPDAKSSTTGPITVG